MRGQHVFAKVIGIAIIAATGLGTTLAGPASKDRTELMGRATSKVELFEISKAKSSGVTDMVIDPGGNPWIMADNKAFYWAGTEFREPASGPLSSGYYLAGLYGGPDRGAYATQRGEKEHEGLLYRLDDGAAELLTTFYYDVSHDSPGIYISKNGRIFNWGDRFLAVYDEGEWSRIEARLSLRLSIVFDCGDDVYFYYDNSLYCATASGQLQQRACPTWVKARPGQNRIVGALWAGRRALLVNYGQVGLFAFDLISGEEIDLREASADLQRMIFYDAFSLRNGEVWILGHTRNEVDYSFFHLSVTGKLSEVIATRALHWDNSRCWQYPESVLETVDGTLLFGLPQDGIAIFRGGELSHWGWQYGFAQGVARLYQDQDGKIWMPIKGRIARLQLGDGPPSPDASALDWQEFALTRNSRVWEPEPGHLAMFRADQTGRLSRWDGTNWAHQEMPFDTTKTGRSATDDRGHLLIAPLAHPDGYFDIGRDSVKRFDTMEALLVSAVAAGAKEFKSDDGFQGIVVTPEKHIWFGYHNYNSVYYYDGVRWDSLGFQDDVFYLFPSLKYRILVRTQGERFYRYELGQMVEVEPSLSQARALMIGEKCLQPYERKMIDTYPGKYFPVLREADKMLLFFDPHEFETSIEDEEARKRATSVALSQYTERISAAASGGAWIFGPSGSGLPSRLFGMGMYPISVGGTPLAGKPILDVKEDRAGGLWFFTRYAESTRVYYHDQGQIELNADRVPDTCERELVVKISILPERMAQGIRIFSRVNDGVWSPAGADAESCTLRFPTSGEYACQITALRMGGRIGKDVSFRVQADVRLPDTVLAGPQDEVFNVDTLEWLAPVEIRKTTEAKTVDLLWRITGGEWRRVAAGTTVVPMSGLDRGEYTIELCAQENKFWRDPSPVQARIRYTPNYEKIVSSCLLDLTSEDTGRREIARQELRDLGPKAVPILERRLQEAEEAAKQMGALREALRELRGQSPKALEWGD